MIKKRIEQLIKKFNQYDIDGYIVPKNDEFFSEYAVTDRLKTISNFSGSAGLAVISRKINYLFVDGRYTLQAKIQSGKIFKIFTLPNKLPSDVLKNKKFSIGYDPKLHTELMIEKFFEKTRCKLMPISENLINKIWLRKNNSNLKYRQTRNYVLHNYLFYS